MRRTQSQAHPALVYGALLGIAVGNTAYNTITKWVLSGATHKADPLCFSLLRDVLAYPILQCGALTIDGCSWCPTRRDVLIVAVLGLLGMFGNQFLFIYGLSDQKISSTLAAVVSQTQPVFGALFAVASQQAQPSWLLTLGVLLTFGGSVIMCQLWSSTVSGDAQMLLHLGSLLLGAACMAAFYVVQKPVLRRIPPLTLTAWAYLFGALWMILAWVVYAFALCSPARRGEMWSSFSTAPTWIALTNAVLVNSVLKYALQSFANK